MIIAGIHNTGITSSAAIVVDGKVVYGSTEDRLNRQKYSKYFPHRAIEAGLGHIGAELKDVDAFAIAWNPAINIGSRYRAGFSEWPAHPGERFYSNANHLLPRLGLDGYTATDQVFHRADGLETRIVHVTHHLAHCAGAYFTSGYENAAILSCDRYGERATTVWAEAKVGDIRILRELSFPHSIGQLYSTITQYLGFRPDMDEWKVMGASAYGDTNRYYDAIKKLIRFDDRAELQLDLRYFQHFDFDARDMFSPLLAETLGPPRQPHQPLDQRHFDLCAALQRVTEEYLFAAISWLRAETGAANLCLSGGVFMNAVANGKIATSGLFDTVHIPFAPDDSGNSIGAALWLANREGEPVVPPKTSVSPFLGPAFDDTDIRHVLEGYKITFEEPDDITAATAQLIDDGQIVGWFQGHMEFGQRALGARSILADPRRADMKERINSAVKFRESFRPFAPAVLAEYAADYFEGAGSIQVSYMEKVLMIREDRRATIPAVVHEDGSGRVQTVDAEMTPLFHQLISRFHDRTGVPVLLNTSFNLNEEPIVCTPSDAVRTFYASGMDALAIGRFLVRK